MPAVPPLTAAGARDLEKRPRPIPRAVRDTVTLMVYGRPDDPDCAPLSFIEAANLAGVKVDVMRRYLDRSDVRALLLSTRRVFRSAICASNEGALLAIRERSANAMAKVAAIKVLEQIDAEATAARPNADRAPGITINVIHGVAPPQIDAPRSIPAPQGVLDAQRPPVIDHDPQPREPGRDRQGYRLDEHGQRMFDPPRRDW